MTMSILYVMSAMVQHDIIYFFFNDTATTEIYTLSLHDALPIFYSALNLRSILMRILGWLILKQQMRSRLRGLEFDCPLRSEEHTSELQSRQYLVCRLLLEKKKKVTCTRV